MPPTPPLRAPDRGLLRGRVGRAGGARAARVSMRAGHPRGVLGAGRGGAPRLILGRCGAAPGVISDGWVGGVQQHLRSADILWGTNKMEDAAQRLGLIDAGRVRILLCVQQLHRALFVPQHPREGGSASIYDDPIIVLLKKATASAHRARAAFRRTGMDNGRASGTRTPRRQTDAPSGLG
ncbi:hypothetical protein HYPSUDRAFT_205833 [Hypholoma sublateritium FD-334 SS-4]|uniref:Uncharacterized protein n=1 Tax=Hypholoma sublateritium (strain FD-334 SS-4) TaxID=945553 RepID=A0A0D2M3T7_HYPSF|nr:hypothetical protein HYPSUDRAFT_205833 [Hypholoma sublateritium FD-334 SS-4]